jgi:hypothetical protein
VKVPALLPVRRTAALAALLAAGLCVPLLADDVSNGDPSPVEALTARVDANTTAIRQGTESASTALAATKRDLEERIDRQGATLARSVGEVHRTLRLASVASVVASLVAAAMALLVFLRIPHILGAIGQIPSAPASPQSSVNGSSPGISAALARIEDRMGVLSRAAPQKNAEAPSPAVPKELLERLAAIEAAVQNLAAARSTHSSNGAADDAFWPAGVRASENYPAWRKSLSKSLAAGKPEAMRLASSLLAFCGQPQRREGDADHHAAFLHELSVNLYAWLYAQDDVPAADRLDPVSAILRAVKDDAGAHYPGLEIRAIFPNERLNTDTMEKVDSGNRMSVARPLSWLVADKSSGKERILFRAKVTTG